MGLIAQQKPAPWTQLSAKDAEKILNDSAWGQTQTETNTSEMIYSPTSGSSGTTSGVASPNASVTMRGEQADRNRNRALEGAYNQAVSINYRIRFFSARPVREALAATILHQHDNSGDT